MIDTSLLCIIALPLIAGTIIEQSMIFIHDEASTIISFHISDPTIIILIHGHNFFPRHPQTNRSAKPKLGFDWLLALLNIHYIL